MIISVILLIAFVLLLPQVCQAYWDWQARRDWATHLRWKHRKAVEARKRLPTAVTERLPAAA